MRRRRDPFFDNAKLLLATLVVVGHGWTLLPDRSDSHPAYYFLYAWHVPAFVLATPLLNRLPDHRGRARRRACRRASSGRRGGRDGAAGRRAQAPGLGFVVLTVAGAVVAVLLAWPPVAQRIGVLVDPIRSVEAAEGPDAEPMPLSTRLEHHPELSLPRHLPR